MAENAFRYETQGTNTYFVYKIQPGDPIDTMALGMLTNNKIPGLATTQFTQMDTERYIKFNVSAKVPVSQFFSGTVNRRRLVGVFKGITSALISAEDYMIDPSSILLDLDYIFADVSTCETVVICLPIERAQVQTDLGQFFKNIVFTTQFDSTENSDYVVKIMNYLNSTPMFSLENFASLLDQLDKGQSGPAAPVKSEAALVQNAQQAAAKPAQQTVAQPAFAPVQTQPAQQPARQPVQTPSVTQQGGPMNLPPQTFPAPPQQPMQAPAAQGGEKPTFFKRLFGSDKDAKAQKEAAKAAKKAGGAQPAAPMMAPAQGYPQQAAPPQGYPQQAAFAQQPQKGKKDKKNQAAPANFQIPGQQQGFPAPGQQQGFPAPGQQANPAAQGQRSARQPGFAVPGQEQNFVSPNSRKAAAKAASKQQAAAPQQGFQPQAAQQGYRPQNIPQPNFPSQTVPQPQQAGFQPQQAGFQPQHAVSQPQQPVSQPQAFPQQSNPAQSQPVNFGETTVLGGNALGETTVLGAAVQEQSLKPHLIRAKNNEQIPVDKPVFRIGKERSYVDYFVGDNPAISRSHANIIARDGVYFIMDTNSTNHTYVNGGMIQSNSEVKISHGTKIRLANEEFEFRLY